MKYYLNYKIYLVYILLMLSVFLIGCYSVNSTEFISSKFSGIDDSIHLNSFPSDVYLTLGKSVLIEDRSIVFRFLAVWEYNVFNSAVQLQIEYDNYSSRRIILNTQESPQSYYLENGYNDMIELKDVYKRDGTFQILFTYNEYYIINKPEGQN